MLVSPIAILITRCPLSNITSLGTVKPARPPLRCLADKPEDLDKTDSAHRARCHYLLVQSRKQAAFASGVFLLCVTIMHTVMVESLITEDMDAVQPNERGSTRVIVLSISVFATGLAFVTHTLVPSAVPMPERWFHQFNFLLGFFAVFGVTTAFARSHGVRAAVMSAQIGIIWVITLPNPNPFSISLFLVFAVVVEAIATLKPMYSAIMAGTAVVIVPVAPQEVAVFGQMVPGYPIPMLILYVLVTAAFTATAYAVRRVLLQSAEARNVRERLEEALYRLAETNMKLQDYSAIVEQHAMEDERKRISQEVHDILGHTLATVNMTLQAAMGLSTRNDDSRLFEMLASARGHVKQGMQELRRELSSLAIDKAASTLKTSRILDLARNVSLATGIEIDVDFANIGSNVGEGKAVVIYRLVQESITNAIRHGSATHIDIHFQHVQGGLLVYVRDNGHGMGNSEPGFGIRNMEERLRSVSGTLTITSEVHGTTLQAWIPTQ